MRSVIASAWKHEAAADHFGRTDPRGNDISRIFSQFALNRALDFALDHRHPFIHRIILVQIGHSKFTRSQLKLLHCGKRCAIKAKKGPQEGTHSKDCHVGRKRHRIQMVGRFLAISSFCQQLFPSGKQVPTREEGKAELWGADRQSPRPSGNAWSGREHGTIEPLLALAHCDGSAAS